MLAYKKLIFEFYPSLKEGNFLGKLVSINSKEKIKKYELKLPTNDMFVKIHGNINLYYTVYEDKNVVLLTTITPENILLEGHRSELTTYKGVMISKNNEEKDIFKINLLEKLERY